MFFGYTVPPSATSVPAKETDRSSGNPYVATGTSKESSGGSHIISHSGLLILNVAENKES